MSDIWMDPVELNGAATVLAQQAVRVRDTVAGVGASCACEVPRSLVGWIDDELVAITEDALRAVIGYLEEAIDAKTRSDQIAADQSLVASQPALGQPTDLAAALAAGAVVGGTGPAFTTTLTAPSTATIGGGDPVVAAMQNAQLVNMGMPSFVDVLFNTGDGISTMLAPPGLSYSNGAYVDGGGDRSTSLATAYEDPVTGELDF